MKASSPFKVGDIVKAFGIEGRIYDIDEEFIFVALATDQTTFAEFLHDGRAEDWHMTPTLEFLRRPDNKKKRKLYIAIKNKALGVDQGMFETSYAYVNELRAGGMWSASHQVVAIEIETDEI